MVGYTGSWFPGVHEGNMEVVSEMPPTAGELEDVVGEDERGVILPDEDDTLLDEIL